MHLESDASNYARHFRLLINVGIAIGVAFVVATGVFFIGYAIKQHSVHARVASAVDEEISKLNIKPPTIEFTSEKATRVQHAIKRGDYATARQITADVLANSQLQNWRYYPFTDFVNGVINLNDPELEAHLNTWVAQSQNDAIPLLFRAQHHYQTGWHKRGNGFVAETPAASMVAFEGYMKKGLADIDAAISLNDAIPYEFYLKLRILQGFGLSQEMKTAFDAAIAKYPGYYPLYSLALNTLQPRWGGTVKAMYAFVDQYAGHAAEYSPLKLLHLNLYRILLRTASAACRDNSRDKNKTAQCVAAEMQKNVTPELEKQVLSALRLYDNSDKYQFGVALDEIILEMLKIAGGDIYAGAFLELAASSMHSNTQLKQDKPGQNNYIIDMALSQSWYAKGFYDNALRKDRDALKDAEVAVFPTEEEKNLVFAKIFEFLSGTYNKLNQYPEMIAYEEAAVRLVGSPAYEHLICYGYYKLKDYDGAVRACTKTIERASEKLQARYWRGKAYWALDKLDAALEDLTAVADSEDSLRTYAGRDLSMVYSNRGDIRGELNVLNKYTHLYDEKINSRDNIAVSYNNRCYVYMELGELEKALDDCTTSLNYGSLPDAYRKQMELTKRLRARETDL